MKKILFIFRAGYDAQYILSNLQNTLPNYEIKIILESGKLAKNKKLKRIIKKYKWYQFIKLFIDLLALLIYDKIMMRIIVRELGKWDYPHWEYIQIDDVNEKKCHNFIREFSPDLILIYGTAILKSDIIRQAHCDIYNIHSSILPYYRNVHSDFWAFMNHEFDKIGITIFKLDAGIDSGDIACQQAVQKHNIKMYSLGMYKVKNLQIVIKLVQEFISKYFDEKVSLIKQASDISSTATTPECKDILRLFMKEGSR